MLPRISAAPADFRFLESRAKASFYRYILLRTAQSRSTAGKWRALPRFAAMAMWLDPAGFLRASWRFCKR